jgi:hypothetical protein
MLVPIALHAEPPARPAPPVVADTAFRDSTLIYLHEMAGTVVDSLEALGVKSPSGLVAVSVGVGGADARMSIIGGNVPDSLRRNVGRIVGTYVNRRGTETSLTFTIRLENVVRGAVTVTQDGDERRPRLRNADLVRAYMGRIVAAYPALRYGNREATINMHVNTRGRVSIVHIAEWAGTEDIDAYLTGLASEMEFTPARVGGQPVPVWVTQTFTFSQ